MWQKAEIAALVESLETEMRHWQAHPSRGVNRLVKHPNGQSRQREVEYPSSQRIDRVSKRG
jgi:hypothetical protein